MDERFIRLQIRCLREMANAITNKAIKPDDEGDGTPEYHILQANLLIALEEIGKDITADAKDYREGLELLVGDKTICCECGCFCDVEKMTDDTGPNDVSECHNASIETLGERLP